MSTNAFIDRNAPNPVVLQVNLQNQIFRNVDMRPMTVPSHQGMISMGAQGGASIQQADRYSAADSSTANTAVQKPRGAYLLATFLGNYLVNTPGTQNTAMSASVYSSQGSYQAVKATIFDEPEVQDESETVFTIATNTFEELSFWMLQRIFIYSKCKNCGRYRVQPITSSEYCRKCK